MPFYRKWRLDRLERKIAGKKAKLAATRELVRMRESTVPGFLVSDMQGLPQEIAELETKAKQLMAPGAGFSTPAGTQGDE